MKTVNRKLEVALLLAGAGLLILSLYFYTFLKNQESQIRVRSDDIIMNAGRLDSYYEQKQLSDGSKREIQEIPDVTLWNLFSQVNITAGDSIGRDGFTMIEGYGDLERIMPGHLAEGVYPVKSDTRGCALSDTGAREIFGSSDVIGKEVVIKDKKYIVRGIVQSKENMVWIQNPESDGYSYMELRYSGNITKSAASAWLKQLGVSSAVVSAGGDYSAFNLLFISFPLWVICLYFYCRLKKVIRNVQKRNQRILFLILWYIVLIFLVMAGLKYSFRFGIDYLPKQWSELSFYSEKLEELMKAARSIAELKPLPGDTEFIRKSRYCAYSAWGSLVFVSMFCCKLGMSKRKSRQDPAP